MQHRLTYCLGAIVLLGIALLYWPVTHFNFIWDDWQSFHDTPWLTQGDEWKHYILRDFNTWVYYFRPLGVGFFTLQVRWFDSTPGPMHAVSLSLHLIDVALVGVLAWRCSTLAGVEARRRAWLTPLCMLLYGLHPALIETVAWIGCQFDLLLTLFVLAGLIANLSIHRSWLRACVITFIFFLAACTKEAALSFPFLLVLFDWMLFSGNHDPRFVAGITRMLRRNWLVYAGIVLAGVGYLIFRHVALGSVTGHFAPISANPLARLWEISIVYLHYLQIIVWPIAGMNPLHPYIPGDFLGPLTPAAWLAMIAATIIVISATSMTLLRRSPFAGMVVAVTLALLPVLHVIPVDFELSLYHERYATLAVAMLCSMLPLLRQPAWLKAKMSGQATRLLLMAGVFLWIACSIIDLRVILPNWANDVAVWNWALSGNPHSTVAKVNLLAAYIKDKDYAEARALGDRVLADPSSCVLCMFKVAELAIDQHEPDRAAFALERARRSPLIVGDKSTLHAYYVLTGKMLILQGKPEDAANVLRVALSLAPDDTVTQKMLDSVTISQNETPKVR
ncbi:tetratricopeptide repeat protein [Dyella sp. C11]|uniref:tetratricopeptide repeat protein n=1 Tax=Dyella sp. C11 TaxID=2126991 RepID=UPI000D6455A5|nr:tetratricopeptide repeat protein [Dyella sp. C11]